MSINIKVVYTRPSQAYEVSLYIFRRTLLLFQLKLSNNKLMKGKALRKHSLHEKTAASVLLKLFNTFNWNCTIAHIIQLFV